MTEDDSAYARGAGRRPDRNRLRVLGLAMGLVGGASVLARADIHVAVQPSFAVVQPGQTFEVELAISEMGSAFNGYDAVIGYDPAYVTFVPRPQAEQEGALMVEACPLRFHVFDAAPDEGTLSIAHILLCAGVSVTGPGVIYRMQFMAGESDVTTTITILPGTVFYQAGTYVTPVLTANAVVQVGNGTGAPPGPDRRDPGLRIWPNPCNPRTTVSFNAAEIGPARLVVFDARGAMVRHLHDQPVCAGNYNVTWDGRDDREQPVGSGVYLVSLEIAGHRWSQLVTLMK